MHFCIFSYNRGQHLANCLESIEKCAPDLKVTVFDDNSNDPETIAVLNSAASKHEVVKPPKSTGTAAKLGGLYANMQTAIEHLRDKKNLCFVQDDMQLIRKVDQQDIESINRYFEKNPNSAFLHHAFLKGSNRERDAQRVNWKDESEAYFRNGSNQSVGVHFAAVAIVEAQRLAGKNWKFLPKEKLNDAQSREIFGKMGIMKNPFVTWLPNGTVYRGKDKTFSLRLAEIVNRSGYYPLAYMSDEHSQSFKQRHYNQLPIAEDFLSLQHGKVREPWRYSPLARPKILKFFHKLEMNIRSLFRKKS